MTDLHKSFNRAAGRIQETFKQDWAFFAALLLVMAAAYALRITSLGFYWDDWQIAFNSTFTHAIDYWNYYLTNRPTGAWMWMLSVPVLGRSPLSWQIVSLLVRWAGTLAFYWALKGLWPRRTWQIRWMALLLVVFPGFFSQPVAAIFFQQWFTFALYTLSLAAMIAAVRRPNRPRLAQRLLTPLALLACLLHVFSMEYFIGLELLRPVILWFLLRKPGEKINHTALRVFKLWAPYLSILILFLGWRFIYFPRIMPGPDPNAPKLLLNLIKAPLATIRLLVQAIIQDSLYLMVFAWTDTFKTSSIDLNLLPTLYSWVVGLGVAALLAWALIKSEWVPNDSPETDRSDAFTGQAALLGVLGILLGGLPVWVLGSQIIDGKWSDRYALAPMVGAVILLVCLMEWAFGAGKVSRKSILLALLLGFSIAFQIRQINLFRRDWIIQRNFYWQLNWRMPALKPGTAVLGAQMPLNYSAVYAIGQALNLIYAPDLHSSSLPYWFIDAPRFQGTPRLPDFKEDLPVSYVMRSLLFQSNTSQAVVVNFDSSSGCFYLLTPADALRPGTGSTQAKLVQISHPDQIETDAAKAVVMPADIFGSEPAHNWCYFYEKADLARQMGDWQKIVDLDQAAGEAGYATTLGVELAPFIEGYAHLGQWQKAYQYTQDANKMTLKMQPFLCQTWDRITKATASSPERDEVLASIQLELKCSKH